MHGTLTLAMLQQHRPHLAYISVVEVVGNALAEVQYLLAPLLLLLGAHLMRNLQSLGTGSLAIGEDMVLCHGQGSHVVVCFLEEFLRFATGSHDSVHAYEGIGHKFQNALHLAAEQCRVVLSAHQAQHLIASALQGNVEVRHKGTALCTELQHLVGEQVGLYAGYAVSLYTLYCIQGLQQVQETLSRGLAEVSDIHSGDDYLLCTSHGCLAGLGNQQLYTAVARASTCKGYGAVGAIIVATILNLKEIARPVSAGA